MPRPRISILLPMRDAAATLQACLHSIARQNEASFQCVVVDDGSIDDSATIAKAMERRDARFALIEQPREGLVAALHAGLRRCEAPLVARMDADDVMHRDRLLLQREMLDAKSQLAGVGCHARAFPSHAFGHGTHSYMQWLRSIRDEHDVMRERFIESPLLHPTWMMRKDAMVAHGYEDAAWAEDYDVLLRMLGAGLRIGVVPRTLHAWRRGPGCATSTDDRYSEERRAELKAAHLCDGPLASGPDYVLWGHGHTGKRLRGALARVGKHPIAIVEIDPRKIGQRHHGADVVSADRLTRYPTAPILVSVAHVGPRQAARDRLRALGMEETRDFWCCA